MNQYISKYIEKAVEELSNLPGIGSKTAMRFVLHLLKSDDNKVAALAQSLIDLKTNIKFCKICYTISDNEICSICTNPKREQHTICIVADIRDVMAIENTQQYNGLYHVLNGVISPMDGIGPLDLTIQPLIKRIEENSEIQEIILAMPTTMEGEMTAHYLFKKIKHLNINISIIARGVSIGEELEYADEVTLGRSILNRLPYSN